MRELLKALELRKLYNKKTIKEVHKELEEYLQLIIPHSEMEEFKYTGLNNIDYIEMIRRKYSNE